MKKKRERRDEREKQTTYDITSSHFLNALRLEKCIYIYSLCTYFNSMELFVALALFVYWLVKHSLIPICVLNRTACQIHKHCVSHFLLLTMNYAYIFTLYPDRLREILSGTNCFYYICSLCLCFSHSTVSLSLCVHAHKYISFAEILPNDVKSVKNSISD